MPPSCSCPSPLTAPAAPSPGRCAAGRRQPRLLRGRHQRRHRRHNRARRRRPHPAAREGRPSQPDGGQRCSRGGAGALPVPAGADGAAGAPGGLLSTCGWGAGSGLGRGASGMCREGSCGIGFPGTSIWSMHGSGLPPTALHAMLLHGRRCCQPHVSARSANPPLRPPTRLRMPAAGLRRGTADRGRLHSAGRLHE